MYANRRRGGNLGLLLLAGEMARFGFDRIPAITLATIVLNVAVYLQFLPIVSYYSLTEVCSSVFYVWQRREWWRLFISTIVHADDMHLYFNMVSFMLKGRTLEKRFGSAYFAYMLIVFTAACSAATMALNYFLAINYQQSFFVQCGVGFSGVIFALKVLTTHYMPDGMTYLFGVLPIVSKWSVWAELIAIQIMIPNASFTGHLAGILVGLLYLYGPLGAIMNTIFPQSDYTSNYSTNYTTYRSYGTTGGEEREGVGSWVDPEEVRRRRSRRFQ